MRGESPAGLQKEDADVFCPWATDSVNSFGNDGWQNARVSPTRKPTPASVLSFSWELITCCPCGWPLIFVLPVSGWHFQSPVSSEAELITHRSKPMTNHFTRLSGGLKPPASKGTSILHDMLQVSRSTLRSGGQRPESSLWVRLVLHQQSACSHSVE